MLALLKQLLSPDLREEELESGANLEVLFSLRDNGSLSSGIRNGESELAVVDRGRVRFLERFKC